MPNDSTKMPSRGTECDKTLSMTLTMRTETTTGVFTPKVTLNAPVNNPMTFLTDLLAKAGHLRSMTLNDATRFSTTRSHNLSVKKITTVS